MGTAKMINLLIMQTRLCILFLLLAFLTCCLEAHTQESAPKTKILDPAAYHIHRSVWQNSYTQFTKEKKGRIAFMGGSITEHGAWREMICTYFRKKFPDTQFEFINAGISSTGSTPGAFRLKSDVLQKGTVDILFEEAAVNDETNGAGNKQQIRGMEGIVRHALQNNPYMDIVIMHFVDPAKMESYNKGIIPPVIANHEAVAAHYSVSTINLAKEVTERIRAGEFTWKDDFKDLHPSPFGHEIYARSMVQFLDDAFSKASTFSGQKKHTLPSMLDPFSYALGEYVPIEKADIKRGWKRTENWVPEDEIPTRKQYVNIPALIGASVGDGLKLRFKGSAIGICIASGPDAGTIEYRIDGKQWKSVDLFTPWSRSLHLPWYVLFDDELKSVKHKIHLRISSQKNAASSGHACRIFHFLTNSPN